ILNYQNTPIDLTPPWHRFTLQQLFLKYANIDLSKNLTPKNIIKAAKEKGYNTTGITTWEPLYTQIFINEIEPHLPTDKPVFIFDYPTQLSPLCLPCPDTPDFSQRFEFYIGGMEIGNAYTELTDGKIMKKNFIAESRFRNTHHLPNHPYDDRFVTAVSKLPSCAGIGLGVDRLSMLFANTPDISDVLYFSTQKLL
ncbi:MAG: amino acid--tRNA ligase-related protein, partial [Candidatus Shapirobacteria bacterium]